MLGVGIVVLLGLWTLFKQGRVLLDQHNIAAHQGSQQKLRFSTEDENGRRGVLPLVLPGLRRYFQGEWALRPTQ